MGVPDLEYLPWLRSSDTLPAHRAAALVREHAEDIENLMAEARGHVEVLVDSALE
jgi:hypothetical protein